MYISKATKKHEFLMQNPRLKRCDTLKSTLFIKDRLDLCVDCRTHIFKYCINDVSFTLFWNLKTLNTAQCTVHIHHNEHRTLYFHNSNVFYILLKLNSNPDLMNRKKLINTRMNQHAILFQSLTMNKTLLCKINRLFFRIFASFDII